jgi:hypothetical protein
LPLGELELLHHWHTAIALSLAQDEALVDVFQTHVPHNGLSYPFLMHSMLAISALHLSRGASDLRRQKYSTLAIQHHSRALSLCAPLLGHVTSANCHALFACALLIASFSFAYQGLHMDIGPMSVSQVVDVFKLVRGTASILKNAQQWIEQGDLRSLSKFTRCAPQSKRSKQVDDGYAQLEALLVQQARDGHSHSSRVAQAVVLRSTKHLRDVYDSCIVKESQRIIQAWPAVIDYEYLDLLLKKERSSLVTLAHYGAILHVTAKAWWMEGWGKILVNVAAEHLDKSVQYEIEWPLAVVNNRWTG